MMRPGSRPVLPSLGRILVVGGAVGLATAGVFAYGASQDPHVTVSGKVVALNGNYPVVQFSAGDGNIIRFTNFTQGPSWHVGDTVSLAYDPANPEQVTIEGFGGRWRPALLAGALGGAVLLLGLLVTILGSRRRAGG